MENCKKGEQVQERQTLMTAFERLDGKCEKLRGVAELTERLNDKLNRIDGRHKCDKIETEKSSERNIVELFNLIAEKIDRHINVIGDNTERSMNMID